MGGQKGVGEANAQGVLLHEMMARCRLSAVSLGSTASGPSHTYPSGDTKTTVEYFLMNIEAASMILSRCTHHMDDVNTSKHLPLTEAMIYVPFVQDKEHNEQQQPRINWDQAKKNGEIGEYIIEVQKRLSLVE